MLLYWSEWNQMFYLNGSFHILLVLVFPLNYIGVERFWFLEVLPKPTMSLIEQIVYTQILELGVLPKLDENYIMFTSFQYFSAFCIKLASLLNYYKQCIGFYFTRTMWKLCLNWVPWLNFHVHCSDEIIDTLFWC